MNDTIFGKIIRGEIPTNKVYEDEDFLAFLDVQPMSKGHTLLIPKTHYIRIHDVPDEIIKAIFVKAKAIIVAMRTALPCDYVQLGVVGHEVPHFHIHLIPRMESDVIPESQYYTYEPDEAQLYATKIKENIA